MTVNTYYFYIKVKYQGGGVHWAEVAGDDVFVLDVICGPSSTVTSEGSFPSLFTST